MKETKLNKTKNRLCDKQNWQTTRLIKKKGEKNKINKVKWERRDYNRQHRKTKDHKRILWALHANKMDNPEEIDRYL